MAQKMVKIRLGISQRMYRQMKQHPEVNWNDAAISGIAERFAAEGIILGGKSRQKP
ncbi:hypothetical protein HYU40_01835 [Candidatus Woesearchaeota archaeon]|nr:hypothetical protein [Candidatus Woesearchaeota archaeon]